MDRIAAAQYLTRDTHLRVSVWNAATGVTVTVALRRLDDAGALTVDEHDITPTTNRARSQITRSLAIGCLVSVQAYVSAGSPLRGQTFVRVELIEGLTGAIRSSSTLIAAYVTADAAASWPGSLVQSPLEGPGVVRHILGANQAAGVEIAETVPTGARWKLRTFGFVFTASGAVANRRPVLTIDDGANILWESSSAVDVTAGQGATYRAGVGVPFFTYGTRAYHLPLPAELLLLAGARIRTATAAIDAADDYAAPIYSVEEWIEA